MILCGAFMNEYSEINAYLVSKEAVKEVKKSENLLGHLVPYHVVERLKEGQAVAEQIDQVPILFADIVGFTNFSSNKKPKKVISALQQLFSRLDNICEKFSCYKVCTIGDCYVAIGYDGKQEKNQRDSSIELMNIIKFGFQMIQEINDLNQIWQGQLQMRIGVHIGNIIGGISGSDIIRYDIYGYDVMVANKMESNGLAGFINVSQSVKNIIESRPENKISFKFNKRVEVKSSLARQKNEIESYFLFSEISEDKVKISQILMFKIYFYQKLYFLTNFKPIKLTVEKLLWGYTSKKFLKIRYFLQKANQSQQS